MKPTLSLCLIVGDSHVSVLARCLKSLLERPSGPACDEIVIDWNGSDDAAFVSALEKVAEVKHPDLAPGYMLGESRHLPNFLRVPLSIHRGADPRVVGFDVARNRNFEHASGEWRGYIDADDVLPLSDDPAVIESLREGLTTGAAPTAVGKTLTLTAWLKSLPPYRNCVFAPYNYISSDKGPLVRNRRPRIIRWDKHWTWVESVHERLVHLLDRMYGTYNPTFVLIHMPIIEGKERQARNIGILEKTVGELQSRGEDLPPQLVYGLAEAAFAQQNYMGAALKYLQAAEAAPDNATKTMYLVQAARSYIEAGQITEAGALALKIIEVVPEGSEGYLIAAEVAFLMKKYSYCIRWYEAGGKHPFQIGGMLDDRIERCMRPVTHVGLAYLMLGKYAQAKEVAELALATASDAFAARIKQVSEDELAQEQMLKDVAVLARTMSERGLLKTALRMVDALSLTLPGLEPVAGGLREQIGNREPKELPGDSAAMQWLASMGTAEDLKVLFPVDAVGDPESLIEQVAQQSLDGSGRSVFLTATDPRANDEYTRLARIDGMRPEELLSVMDRHGKVETLQLLEGEPRALVASFVPRASREGAWQPDITFFAPVFIEPWGPWRLWRDGTGGSEESVIYLAREFAQRGYRVQVFASLDPRTYRDVHVEDGVRWRPLDAFDPVKEIPGIVISCRAPFAISMPACVPERTYIWHQDAFYSMAWTKSLCDAAGHFFVSQWQANCLLSQVGAENYRGAVVGDGIPSTCFDWQKNPPARDPFAVAYLSSPIRGLDFLLDVWPSVMQEFPQASLHVFYGWHTMPGSMGSMRESIMRKLASTKGVVWRDRIPQNDLEQELPKFGVFAYPTEFLEGFCIAGVRATAAGMVPVYATTGAMGEIQYKGPHSYTVSGEATEAKIDRPAFLPALLKGMRDSANISLEERIKISNWAKEWDWSECADLMEREFRARDNEFDRKEVAR